MRFGRLFGRCLRGWGRPAVAAALGAAALTGRPGARAAEPQPVRSAEAEVALAAEEKDAEGVPEEEPVAEERAPGVEVCGEEELKEGQMKEFVIGPNEKQDRVVVARVDGSLYAVSAFCTHFNFQLAKGVLLGERLFCPLHLACFSVKTGLNEFGPTLRALSVHPVSVRDGRVLVHWTPGAKTAERPPARRDPHDHRHFLVVGGGPAGLAAAETLRQSGFRGRLTIVAAEEGLPFDRTALSKSMDTQPEQVSLRSREYLQERDIDLLPGIVTQIDDEAGTARLADGSRLDFTKALLATGGTPRNPFGPQALTLRTHADLAALRERAKNAENIVILGSSYIAVEAASMLREAHKTARITLVTRTGLYGGRLAPEATRVMSELVQKAGIELRKGEAHALADGRVVLVSGEAVPADLVLAAVGIAPNAQPLRPELRGGTGGCRVDRQLQASERLFAAGDVAEVDGRRIEHYSEAIEQGMIAGWNMLGKKRRHAFVPFFWTRAFNQSVASVGLAPPNPQIVLHGDPAKPSFVEFQCDEAHCPAMQGVNAGEKMILFAQALRMGRRVTPGEAARPGFFDELKAEIRANARMCCCARQESSR